MQLIRFIEQNFAHLVGDLDPLHRRQLLPNCRQGSIARSLAHHLTTLIFPSEKAISHSDRHRQLISLGDFDLAVILVLQQFLLHLCQRKVGRKDGKGGIHVAAALHGIQKSVNVASDRGSCVCRCIDRVGIALDHFLQDRIGIGNISIVLALIILLQVLQHIRPEPSPLLKHLCICQRGFDTRVTFTLEVLSCDNRAVTVLVKIRQEIFSKLFDRRISIRQASAVQSKNHGKLLIFLNNNRLLYGNFLGLPVATSSANLFLQAGLLIRFLLDGLPLSILVRDDGKCLLRDQNLTAHGAYLALGQPLLRTACLFGRQHFLAVRCRNDITCICIAARAGEFGVSVLCAAGFYRFFYILVGMIFLRLRRAAGQKKQQGRRQN